MPTTPLSDWDDWTLTADDRGTLTVEDGAGQLVGSVGVDFGPDWQLTAVVIEADEVEITATSGPCTASVRHTIDRTWTLRVVITGADADPTIASRPVIRVSGPFPPAVWDAHELGWVILGASEQLLVGELISGAMAQGGRPDAQSVQIVCPTSRCVWRFDRFANERRLAARLPGWWPEQTALRPLEGIDIELPDGAVSGAESRSTEGGLEVLGLPRGRQRAVVHTGRLNVALDLYYAPDLDTVLSERARQILDQPGDANPTEALVVARTATRGAINASPAVADLVFAAAASVRMAGVANPLQASLLTLVSQITGNRELLAAALQGAAAHPAVPGSGLAWIEAAVPATLSGLDVPAPAVEPAELPAVEALLVEAEAALLQASRQPHPPEEAINAFALLGGGLPVRALGDLHAAQVVALAGLAAEHWLYPDGWAHDLAAITQQATRQLLASSPSDEVLAWLSWR